MTTWDVFLINNKALNFIHYYTFYYTLFPYNMHIIISLCDPGRRGATSPPAHQQRQQIQWCCRCSPSQVSYFSFRIWISIMQWYNLKIQLIQTTLSNFIFPFFSTPLFQCIKCAASSGRGREQEPTLLLRVWDKISRQGCQILLRVRHSKSFKRLSWKFWWLISLEKSYIIFVSGLKHKWAIYPGICCGLS